VPAGGELNVSTPGAGLMVMETGPDVVFAGLAESETCTVMTLVPAVVGVQETVQLPANVRPAGNVPPVCSHV
jgi:hypothetical protein